MMKYLGLCAVIRDEDPFLDEWMAYYLHLGVEEFFLYDNGSRIPLRRSLAKFAGPGGAPVRVHDAPGRAMQMVVYNHCLGSYVGQCRWMAFVDVDEFIVPREHDALAPMLQEFEPYAGLAVNWRVFGSGGHKLRPAGLQLENYTRALEKEHPIHKHVKCVVDPGRAKFFFNPHMCMTREPGENVVTENHEPLAAAVTEVPSWEKGQINHYYFRSKQDYHAKLQTPRADLFKPRAEVYAPAVSEGDEDDACAVRFADGVRRVLERLGG